MQAATKLALVIGGTGLALTAGSLNAFASWTSAAPTATMTVAAAALPGGETPTVAARGTDALVRWKPSVLRGGVRVRKYTVTRWRAGRSVVVCDRVPATSCTDRNLAEGTWTWRVRPSVGDWSGTDSADSAPLVILPAKDAVPKPAAGGQRSGPPPAPAPPAAAEPTRATVEQPPPAPSAPGPPPAESTAAEPVAEPPAAPAAVDGTP